VACNVVRGDPLDSPEQTRTAPAGVWRSAAAFVFIGLDPNTAWLRATVELDPWGFVRTDEAFGTSIRGVFCAGDARAGSTKQLGSAVGDGIAALIAVRGYLQRHSDLRRIDVNA